MNVVTYIGAGTDVSLLKCPCFHDVDTFLFVDQAPALSGMWLFENDAEPDLRIKEYNHTFVPSLIRKLKEGWLPLCAETVFSHRSRQIYRARVLPPWSLGVSASQEAQDVVLLLQHRCSSRLASPSTHSASNIVSTHPQGLHSKTEASSRR